MPLVPGLSPSIRLEEKSQIDEIGPMDVQIDDGPADVPDIDDSGAILKIDHGDGSITRPSTASPSKTPATRPVSRRGGSTTSQKRSKTPSCPASRKTSCVVSPTTLRAAKSGSKTGRKASSCLA